jgi:hypothetical protein
LLNALTPSGPAVFDDIRGGYKLQQIAELHIYICDYHQKIRRIFFRTGFFKFL